MTELDDALREHFSKVALDTDTLTRIHAAANQNSDAASTAKDQSLLSPLRATLRKWIAFPHANQLANEQALRTGRYTALRFTALAVLVVTVGVFMRSAGTIEERSDSAIREVAMNHATQLSFEFKAQSLAALDKHMNHLPFELSVPSRMAENIEVLGSRYCTLSGQLAAHVKLREGPDGKSVSLFVTNSAPALKQLDGESGDIDGVDVELFDEDGLFFAYVQQ